MTLRLIQGAALLILGACGAAPSSSAQQSSSGKPFVASEVTRFEAPWAMDFLPGSGVPKTNIALVTEKAGKQASSGTA